MKKGFTMLEVMTGLFVLVVGLGGTLFLITQTFWNISLIKNKLVAAYLIQEGIEKVRNQRDTNFIRGNDWIAGISSSTETIIINNKDFQRRIIVSQPDGDTLTVRCRVSWSEKRVSLSMETVANLKNWR